MNQPLFLVKSVNGEVTLNFFYTNGSKAIKTMYPKTIEEGETLARSIRENNHDDNYECIRTSSIGHHFRLFDTENHPICESIKEQSYRNCGESCKAFQKAVANANLDREIITNERVDW